MRILNIKLEGFRGVRKPLEIPCGPGFTVVCGQNGAGKSTICDAIEFALSGSLKLHEGSERGEYISNYLWWRGSPAAQAQYVVLEIGDSRNHSTTLRVTPGDSSGAQSAPSLVDIDCAPTDWRNELCLTSILRDESITTLSTDIPERDRYDFALRAMGLASSVVVEKRIGEVVKILESEQARISKAYDQGRDRVEAYTAELSQARVSATRASDESLERLRRDYADVLRNQLDLSGVGSFIGQRVAQLRERTNALERLRNARQSLENEKAHIRTPEFQSKLEQLESDLRNLQASTADAQKAFESATSLVQREQSRSPFVTSLATLREHGQRIGLQDQRCPLCGSVVTPRDFELHLAEMEAAVKQASTDVGAAVRAERESRAALENLRGRLQRADREYRSLKDLAESLSARDAVLNDEAARLSIGSDVESIIKDTENSAREISRLNEDLAIIEAYASIHRVSELEELLRDAQQRAERDEKEVRRVSKAMDAAHEIRAAANRVSGEIVRERLAALTPLFTEMSQRLRPHSEWSEIDFLLRGDVRPFLSFVVGGDINPRFVFSSGQRRALGLAFLLAVHLARPWCKLETLILDDPVQHIDDYRALHLVETLSALRMSGRQIICTVEDPVLADLLCRRLRSRTGSEGLRVELENLPGQGVQIKEMRRILPTTMSALAAD